MNPRVNEELIDHLVCGTLKGADYRKAILALEADPQKWRECALAFLQEQAISQELTQLSHADIRWQQGLTGQPGNVAGNGVGQLSLSVAPRNQIVADGSTKQHSDLGWLYKLGTLAALLLLSFSVGWIGSSIRDRSLLADQGGSANQSDLARDTSNVPILKVDQMSVDQVLPATKFGSNNYSLVGNNSASLIPIDEQIPANLAKLEREGRIRIETTTAIMPVEYEGGTVLVPVQQFRVVPVTFSY